MVSANNRDRARIEALAEKYIKKEKYEEAIAEYQKLLTGDEQDIPIRNIIGDLHLKANQKDQAVEEFKKIASHFEKKGLFPKSIAIYKRITRIAPGDLDALQKLAALYRDRGLVPEALVEYRKLAEHLRDRNRIPEAIQIFEQVLKLDPEDETSWMSLAELHEKEGHTEQAVEALNTFAEARMRQDALKEAQSALERARALDSSHPRTLENLVNLLKRKKKKKEALKLVNEIIRKDKDNLNALYILGRLCFEDGEDEKAVEVFNRILTSRPQETEARIKLGRIHVRNKQYDEAFEVLEPLVENLFQKHREEQAVGVLGLILVQNRGHCPTLEKLASLYREKGQKKNLEIVGRRLLREYREQGEDSKARVIGEELARLFPEKPEYAPYAAQETEAVAEPEAQEEAPAEELTEQTPAPEEAVEAPEYELEKGLAQADLYLDQGLIRNAKRILEHLRMQYPEDPRIAQKMESLSSLAAQVKEEELVQRIEKASERETDLFESGEKLTAAEIFADTDIIPLVTEETGEKRYYDLSRQIEEELQAIQNISSRQARGDTPLDEKELPVIVAEFRKKVDEKVGTADLELRYNLGIAYLEQGLLDEAKREFELASEDPRWKIESFTNLAECSKRQDSLDQALEWYQKALEEAGEETVQGFVLKYEMASLLEARGDAARALELYRDVKKWNPEYADVAEKIQSLEKQASSSSR